MTSNISSSHFGPGRRLGLVLLLIAVCSTPGAASSDPLRILIVTGQTDMAYHDWRVNVPFLRGVLANTGRFEVRVLEEPRGLTREILAGYDGVVLHYNGPRWGGAAEQALEEFIHSGHGMVAVHGVSYGPFFGYRNEDGKWVPSGAPWPGYSEMLGMSWKTENIGHARRGVFTVKWVDRQHPIALGLEPSFTATDELYHKMDLKPGAHVLATAWSDPAAGGTGKDEPQIWNVPFGQGRVVHITLGHDLTAMSQPGFLAAFARATEWSASGAVTLPAQISAWPKPAKDAARVLVVTGGHGYPAAFYTLFEGYRDVTWSHATSPSEAFKPGLRDRFDTIVLHDMHNELGEKEQVALREFVEAGGGIVSIHHAIVDYTSWPWWHEEVIGGKYYEKAVEGHQASAFKEGVEITGVPTKAGASHPVMRGVPPLVLDDEAYRGMWISPKVTVLMETDHPLNDKPVVYIGPYSKARVVYIQFGHSESTHRNPGYRTLVHNAILWTAHSM